MPSPDKKSDAPEGFTLALALVDAVPASAAVFGAHVESRLFVAGAIVAFLGGAGKVAWKLLLALARRDVGWLSRQMRYVMPAGFALMLTGALTHAGAAAAALGRLRQMPSLALVAIWLDGMCAMG